MKLFASTPRVLARSLQYLTSATAVVIAVGIVGSVLAATNASKVSKDLLLYRAATAAAAFSGEEINQINDNGAINTKSETYKSLRRRLVSIREGNGGTRFVYLLGKNNQNQVIFLVDSENESSPSYSPPGIAYPEASPLLKSTFFNKEPIFEGPLKDSYGNWVTAAAPVTDSHGKIVAVVGIDTPANEYYQFIAIRALVPLILAAIPAAVLIYNRRLAKKEHEIDELKMQFVSIASHELRSPLTGTLWGIQSLLKAKHGVDQESTMMAIYNNIATSLATVNEILDFSIFERGSQANFQREIVDIKLAITDIIKLYQLSADEKNITFSKVGRWPEEALTIGDPGSLKRAIGNIISNAIKYSPDGGKIEIALHTEKNKHVIGVRDHGIGIPKADQNKVLAGYYRAKNASKVKAYGTGMGLWLARKITEEHKGRLWLQSKEDAGSTFFISLPAKRLSD